LAHCRGRHERAEHKASNRRERVTIERADIYRAACPAAGTTHIKPRCSGGDGTTDGWRPQHRPLGIPARSTRRSAASWVAGVADTGVAADNTTFTRAFANEAIMIQWLATQVVNEVTSVR